MQMERFLKMMASRSRQLGMSPDPSLTGPTDPPPSEIRERERGPGGTSDHKASSPSHQSLFMAKQTSKPRGSIP